MGWALGEGSVLGIGRTVSPPAQPETARQSNIETSRAECPITSGSFPTLTRVKNYSSGYYDRAFGHDVGHSPSQIGAAATVAHRALLGGTPLKSGR